VIEKAPIDAITGNSRNTLAEERLLKNRVEYETMVKIRISHLCHQDLKIQVHQKGSIYYINKITPFLYYIT
jgi:hypothetical protein